MLKKKSNINSEFLSPLQDIANKHYKKVQEKKARKKAPKKVPITPPKAEDLFSGISDQELEAVFDEVILDRELGSRSMRDYAKMCWAKVEPGVEYDKNAWHSDCLSDHLQAVVDGQIKKLLISIPPGHGKSTWACVFMPTYAWIKAPHTKMMFGSYGYDLAQRDAEKCLKLLKSKWWKDRWGYAFDLTRSTHRKVTNDQGGIRGISSVGGQTLGYRADIVVADDPLNIKEVDSEIARRNMQTWWVQGMRTRGDIRQREVVIMQRLHDDDLIGYLLAEVGGYEVLKLPAEFIPEERCTTFTIDGDKFWEDPRKEEDEVLFPSAFPVEYLNSRGRLSDNDHDRNMYSAMYQQNPVQPGGNIIKKHWFRYYQIDPVEQYKLCSRAVLSCDPAVKDKETSTYTVVQIWGVSGPNVYLIDQLRARLSFTGVLEGLNMMINKWNNAEGPGVNAKLVEDKASGPMIIETLSNKFPGIIAWSGDDDKIARMEAITWLWEGGNVYVPGKPAKEGDEGRVDFSHVPWMAEWYDEITRYPKARFTDQAITMSQAMMYMARQMKNLVGVPIAVSGSRHISDLRRVTGRNNRGF